jgi:POT family proton-dependent oligopeptide transporter
VKAEQPAHVVYPYATRTPRTFLGHPTGLVNLFLTEMWERFSFYGMRAILVLFLVDSTANGGLGLGAATAAALYSVYNATVYLLALPGGWVADRLTGTRRAVLIGGIVIATGHYVLAIPAGFTVYFGLMLVAIGTGLLKPNISTMVGELYDRLPDEHHARRDSGFSIFYMGINVGAWAGALVTGWLGVHYGWHAGFAAAAVGMTIALVQYVAAGRSLGDVGLTAHRPLDEYRRGLVLRRVVAFSLFGLAALALASILLAAATDRSVLDAVLLLVPPMVVAVPVVFFASMLGEHTLSPPERSRVVSYVPIFCAAALFWMIYDQAGNLLNLFAADKVDNQVFGLNFPVAWYQSINPLLILVFAPLFAVMWARLGNRAPSTPIKFAIGLLGIGGSFVIMGFAGAAATQGRISPLWLFSVYLVQTLAELFLSPVGLSVTTKLAPPRFSSQMMGLWFLATATGNAVGGYVVRLNGVVSDAVYYGLLGGLAVIVGILFVFGARRIRTRMAGVA